MYHAGRYTLLDSMPGPKMQRRAQLLATRLRDAFDLGAGAEGVVRVHEPKCPRQDNGFDCGVYTIAFVQQLAVTGFDTEALAEITSEWITRLRSKLLVSGQSWSRRRVVVAWDVWDVWDVWVVWDV